MNIFFENKFVYLIGDEKGKNEKAKNSSSLESAAKSKKDLEAQTLKKKQDILDKTKDRKKALAELVMKSPKKKDERVKLKPDQLKEAKAYMKKYPQKDVAEMLKLSDTATIYDLRRGGTLRLMFEREKDPKKKAELKKQLKKNMGYAEMTAQFAGTKVDKQGRMYLDVDLKNKTKYEQGLGAGHLCPPSWKKVAIEDTYGSVRVGYRTVPGVNGVTGKKIGYRTSFGADADYLDIYSGYKIYPLEIETDPKKIQAQIDIENKFYGKGPQEPDFSKSGAVNTFRSNNPYTGNVKSVTEMAKNLGDASKEEMIRRGSTPFSIRPGYNLSVAETNWYRNTSKEYWKLARMNIKQRWDIQQERFRMMDALKYSAQMVGIDKKNFNLFWAMNDAVQYVESGYNNYNFNKRRVGNHYKVVASSAAGEMQILNSVWKGARKYQDSKYEKQFAKIGIDHDMFKGLNLNAERPEYGTPYQRVVLHNLFMYRYSRLLGRLESVDRIFDHIKTKSGGMKESWMRVGYLYWRNGPGGAAAFIRNLRKGIPLPRNEEERRYYFDNYLTDNDWQKRRGYADFRMVMMVTQKFAGRFRKNLTELGEA